MGGIQPLWRDANACHQQQPMHVMVGGGDQLYCDAVWEIPTLVEVGGVASLECFYWCRGVG